tara:strand:+ start:239 stop:451 length:213 start_codon:yes stop_codon:yes gene_type:complete
VDMSLESELGRKLYELRDFVVSQINNSVVETYRSTLTKEELKSLLNTVTNSVNMSFDRGSNNVLSVVKKQ